MKTQKQLLVRRFMSDDCPREIIKAWNQRETRRIRFVKANTELTALVNATPAHSAWSRGVKTYALELIEGVEDGFTQVSLLNGAQNWREYSYGGCALIYDADIAERLCAPSEYKRTREGQRAPNSRESWLDVQARALGQAANLIASALKEGSQ